MTGFYRIFAFFSKISIFARNKAIFIYEFGLFLFDLGLFCSLINYLKKMLFFVKLRFFVGTWLLSFQILKINSPYLFFFRIIVFFYSMKLNLGEGISFFLLHISYRFPYTTRTNTFSLVFTGSRPQNVPKMNQKRNESV